MIEIDFKPFSSYLIILNCPTIPFSLSLLVLQPSVLGPPPFAAIDKSVCSAAAEFAAAAGRMHIL